MTDEELEIKLQRDRLETDLKHCELELKSLSAKDNKFRCQVQSMSGCYGFLRNIEFTPELAERLKQEYMNWLSVHIEEVKTQLYGNGTY